jgi:transposase InsO family protein
MELNLKERQKLTAVTAKKYRTAKKKEKAKILDTFTGQTGYGRKHAIRILANEGKVKLIRKRVRLKITHKNVRKRVYPVIYDKAVQDAPALIREAFNYQCGKLLAPFLHANISRIVSEPRFNAGVEVTAKLGKISASTIDRLLKQSRKKLKIKGTSGTKGAAKHLKNMIPALSHFECVEQGSGLWQIDLVQHDGGNPSGEFCFTLTVTEVKNAWTVRYALKNKAFCRVYKALDEACSQLPVPVRILHSDNGSEFINHALMSWCKQRGITLTRSRGSKKNDNCFVEQKNGATVRKNIGYLRYSGGKGVAALQAVYTHYDRLFNFFYPGRKLVSKERINSKVKRKYDNPQTPYDRVVFSADTPQEIKRRLTSLKKRINLMTEMKLMQQALDKLPSFAEPVPELVSRSAVKPLRFGSHGSIS